MQTIKRWIYGGLTNGGEIRKPELWVFNAIEENGNNLVFQCGNDIITIRRPEPGELVLGSDGT